MNRDLFGFKSEPFSVYPDNKYFFSSISHDKAISLLEYGINSRKGFMLLTGLKGSGKTTTCSVLKENLKECNTVVVGSGLKETDKLMKDICAGFGIHSEAVSGIGALMDYFVSEYKNGRNNLIIIDNAEDISDESLEFLNSFMEIEIENCKLVQIILCGSPAMHDRLKNISTKLGPKFTFTVELAALTMKDTADYVAYRLKTAMGDEFPVFRKTAFVEIYHYSKGIPSEINRVAQKAIEIANDKKSSRVAPTHVKMAAASLYGASRRRSLALLPAYIVMVAVILFAGYFALSKAGKKEYASASKPPVVKAEIQKSSAEPAEPVKQLHKDVSVKPEPVPVETVKKKTQPAAENSETKTKKAEPAAVLFGCVSTSSGLKIRVSPDVKSASKGNVPYKGKVKLIAKTPDGEWWDVEYKGKEGYMFAKYISVAQTGECR